MYPYHAYGLSCLSNTPIPGFPSLAVNAKRPDLIFSLGPSIPDWVRAARRLPSLLYYVRPSEMENPAYKVMSLGSGAYFELSYSDGTQFVLSGTGDSLWGTYSPPLTIDDFSVYLRGPVMGFILQRRKIHALHASSLFIDGRAVALCGPKESGKSTIAAALCLRGIPLLSEDVSALTNRDGITRVEPGYPWICLWPEAVKALLGASNAAPRLTPNWEKCFLPLENSFECRSKILGAIYLLSARSLESRAPRIEHLNRQEALLGLVQNTYMNWLLGREQRAAEFDFLTRLITQVPVRRIVPHADSSRIGELCDLILADVERLTSHPASHNAIPIP